MLKRRMCTRLVKGFVAMVRAQRDANLARFEAVRAGHGARAAAGCGDSRRLVALHAQVDEARVCGEVAVLRAAAEAAAARRNKQRMITNEKRLCGDAPRVCVLQLV